MKFSGNPARSSTRRAATAALSVRPWPMIILKTPKGWTGPKEVDGLKTEGFWRSHQVPFADYAPTGASSARWNSG